MERILTFPEEPIVDRIAWILLTVSCSIWPAVLAFALLNTSDTPALLPRGAAMLIVLVPSIFCWRVTNRYKSDIPSPDALWVQWDFITNEELKFFRLPCNVIKASSGGRTLSLTGYFSRRRALAEAQKIGTAYGIRNEMISFRSNSARSNFLIWINISWITLAISFFTGIGVIGIKLLVAWW